MSLFYLKIQAAKKEIINSSIEGNLALEIIKPIEYSYKTLIGVLDWNKLKIIIKTAIIQNKASFLAEYGNNEIVEKKLNTVIAELDKSLSYVDFSKNYSVKNAEIKDSEQADRIVENFSKIYVEVLTQKDLKIAEQLKLLDSLHTESFLNAGGYNNFNYLIMKIITNPKIIENKKLFYENDGKQGFLFQLVEKSVKKTGTFYECAKEYLKSVYTLEFKKGLVAEDKDSIKDLAVDEIMYLISENKNNYDEYELFKMQELYRLINNRYSVKYIKNSVEQGLLATAKSVATNVLDKKEQFLFSRIIEDLQRGSLNPVKYEDMPELYENEELLIAYFRMVNYLLMNYPEAIGIEEYGKFVYTIKSTWHRFNNVLNNELFYCFLYELYEKNYLKPKDYNHAWDFHLEGEEPADSLNVIFYSSQYKDKIDKTKIAAYKKLLFLQ